MIIGIRHTGFNARDLAALDSFYVKALGLKKVWEKTEETEYAEALWGIKSRISNVKYQAPDGTIIEFVHRVPTQQHIDFTHICLITDNIKEEYFRLIDRGWYFIGEPIITPDGNSKLAICFDPNGLVIELLEIILDWQEEN